MPSEKIVPESVSCAAYGITSEQAADLRQRLAAFAEDWQRPEMNAYDSLPVRQDKEESET